MASEEIPYMEYWEVVTKWGGSSAFGLGHIGFLSEKDAESYLEEYLQSNRLRAYRIKALEPCVLKRKISYIKHEFDKDFDKSILQRDITKYLENSDYSAREEKWMREADWDWVWDIIIRKTTHNGGQSFGGVGYVYLEQLNADHACYLDRGDIPDNIRRKLDFEIPRVMYAEYIAPRFAKIKEKRKRNHEL